MILGLLGPSCCGKSHFLEVLNITEGYFIPRGVTTRDKRVTDNGDLLHVNVDQFKKLQKEGMLQLVADVFDNYYAYENFHNISDVNNIAVEIVRENISELKKIGGIVGKIMPMTLEIGISKISERRSQGILLREKDLRNEFLLPDNDLFDFIFFNEYTEKSVINFLKLLKDFKK